MVINSSKDKPRTRIEKARVALVCALILLAGCGQARSTPTPAIQGTKVPFETIQQVKYGYGYEEKNPLMIVLTRAEDAGELQGLVSEVALERVGEIDFERELAIAVFQGWKPSTGYEVQVWWVIHTGKDLVVGAGFINPPEDREVQDEVTSPYHLIRISREDLHGISMFILNANGEEVFQVEKTIE